MISMLAGGTILLQFQGSRVMDKAVREHAKNEPNYSVAYKVGKKAKDIS